MSTDVTAEAEKMLNVGVRVTLKKLGDITVKELSLENILLVGRELGTLLMAMPKGDDGGTTFMFSLLSDPATTRAVQAIAAASTGKVVDDFVDMSVTDWMRWLVAFKEITDWEELRNLFTQVVPLAVLQRLFQSAKA